MAEETRALHHLPKAEAYDQLEAQLSAVLAVCEDDIAAMASVACLVHHAFSTLWTGFYRLVAPGLLRVGPYQGTLGCLEIDFGPAAPRIGVCGTAARDRRTLIVADVALFPGHITCDARSRSEIVVPVFDGSGGLIGVFDIDADRPSAFDAEDGRRLESLLSWFALPRT